MSSAIASCTLIGGGEVSSSGLWSVSAAAAGSSGGSVCHLVTAAVVVSAMAIESTDADESSRDPTTMVAECDTWW